jgi:hypothetical protein
MDYRNGAGELVQLEHDDVFPLLKSSSVANGRVDVCERWILMTQRHAGDDTSRLKVTSPLAWEYLNKHASLLDKRASSIYRNQHPYAMFGVGPYTFAPWKIAISGLYKRLTFQLVPPQDGKPKILDDTCYFIPFEREELARLTLDLLNSVAAREYFESLIFWDAKRPITADILRSLDIERVAHSVGQIDFNLPSYCAITATKSQLSLGGN